MHYVLLDFWAFLQLPFFILIGIIYTNIMMWSFICSNEISINKILSAHVSNSFHFSLTYSTHSPHHFKQLVVCQQHNKSYSWGAAGSNTLCIYQLLAFKWWYQRIWTILSTKLHHWYTRVTGDANIKRFLFSDATSDQLSKVMKQWAQNVIFIIQL